MKIDNLTITELKNLLYDYLISIDIIKKRIIYLQNKEEEESEKRLL